MDAQPREESADGGQPLAAEHELDGAECAPRSGAALVDLLNATAPGEQPVTQVSYGFTADCQEGAPRDVPVEEPPLETAGVSRDEQRRAQLRSLPRLRSDAPPREHKLPRLVPMDRIAARVLPLGILVLGLGSGLALWLSIGAVGFGVLTASLGATGALLSRSLLGGKVRIDRC
jgi:hypothetical protein